MPSFELTDDVRSEVTTLVRLLDGLPLAIELAAARSGLLSPSQLRGRLKRRFELLRSRGGDVAPRQRTLAATLEWSWDLLTSVEQGALAQLSVFEGGFTVEAAEEVLDLATDDDSEPPGPTTCSPSWSTRASCAGAPRPRRHPPPRSTGERAGVRGRQAWC